MKIGVPRETHPGERRVATTPDVAAQLQKLGYDVVVEKDCTAVIEDVIERYSGIDVLVNNAGITTMGSIEDLDLDAFAGRRIELELATRSESRSGAALEMGGFEVPRLVVR